MCISDGCKRTKMYNFKGNKPIYCSLHKEKGMIDVCHKKCCYEDCEKIPTCNFNGEIKAIYCFEHKEINMVNVKDKKCIFEDCNTQSVFNYEGLKEKLYCSKHKKDGMVNVKNKKCHHDGCNKVPSYNFKNEIVPIYCSLHKKEEMIDVSHKKCIYEECNKIPTYNYEEEDRPIYCSIHKEEDMVNVKHKKCNYEGCNKIPAYNLDGQKQGIYCVSHKKNGMINVIGKKCIFKGCKITPFYNYEGEKQGIYCVSHKKNDMIDVKSKTCKNDWCYTRVQNNKYDSYCFNCYLNMFPDKPVSRNYKTKEYSVIEFIKNKIKDITCVCDKIIKDGCSKRRPDLLIDLGYQIIIIEIDENQHNGYDCSCENKRIMELSQDLQHRPIIFIRFNPDEYTINNQNITSCWGLDGKGICAIKKTKQKEWNERLNTLFTQIEYWLNPQNITNKTVEIIQLFYDEYNLEK